MKLFLLTLISLFGAPVVHAEDLKHDAAPTTLDKILITGTKEEETYFETPESVSILQKNQLSPTGRQNNLTILNGVPNVQVNRNGDSFSIRGMNSAGVTGYQKDSLASVVIDDLYQTNLAMQAGSFDMWDMDHIEILKGAQSTTQGFNSLAGTILMNHKAPQDSSGGAAKLGLGNFGFKEARFAVNNELIKNKLTSRITYDKEIDNGFITNIATGNHKWGGWDKDRVNLGLNYKISENHSLNLTSKVNHNAQGGTYVQGSDAFKYQVDENQDYKSTTRNYQLVATDSLVLSSTLTNTTVIGYSRTTQDALSDADGTPLNTAGTRDETHGDHYFSFENRLRYKTETTRNLFGIHAHDLGFNDGYIFNLLYPLGGSNSTPIGVHQGVNTRRRVYALFDSLTYQFTERHSLIAGARLEHVQSGYDTGINGQRLQDLGTSYNSLIDGYLSQVSGVYGGNKTNVVFLPKLGYTYHVDNHYSGLTFKRAYRTAGVSINRRRATAVSYGPEFTDNYEAFYKYAGKDFQLGTNFFYINWKDQQVLAQLSSDFYDTQVQNAASSALYGTELEGRYHIAAGHDLNAGIGYVTTRFKDFKTKYGDYNGHQFPFASHTTGRLSYQYKSPSNFNLLSIVQYVGPSYTNAENTRRADAQFYLNFNAQYAIHQIWLIEAYLNNALNGQYRIYDGTPTSTTSPYQASYHQTGTPREFGVRATYYW